MTRRVARLLRLMDELDASEGSDELARVAVSHATGSLGVERAWLCVRDRRGPRIVLRGSWRATADAESPSNHDEFEYVSREELVRLLSLHDRARGWRALDQAELDPCLRWCVETPLVARGDVMAVMYNDGGPAGACLNERLQDELAEYCGVLAQYLRARRGPAVHPPGPRRREALVGRIVARLKDQPDVSGRALADGLGVSAGHVARTFRAATGLSLVEYRNRLRVRRFLELVRRKSGLTFMDAAMTAGFGNYSHFHRVFRALTGDCPKAVVASGSAPPALPEALQFCHPDDEGASPLRGEVETDLVSTS